MVPAHVPKPTTKNDINELLDGIKLPPNDCSNDDNVSFCAKPMSTNEDDVAVADPFACEPLVTDLVDVNLMKSVPVDLFHVNFLTFTNHDGDNDDSADHTGDGRSDSDKWKPTAVSGLGEKKPPLVHRGASLCVSGHSQNDNAEGILDANTAFCLVDWSLAA